MYFNKNKNFDENPQRIYLSKKTNQIYAEGNDKIEMEKPLTGLSLLLYNYVEENNLFKIYDLKPELK